MRLIDADASDLQRELFSFTRYTGIDEMPYENACMALDIAPTVDAVPLSAIEDIRAEIKSKMFKGYANDNGSADLPDHQAHFNSGLILALEIIDKHISGKEQGE